jgi:hypothetical protein
MSMPRARGKAILAMLGERWRLKRRGLAYKVRAAADVPPELQHRINVLCSLYPLGLTDVLRGHRFQTMNLRLSLDSGVPANILRAIATEIIYIGVKGTALGPQLDQLLRITNELIALHPDPFLEGGVSVAAGAAATVRGEWKLALARCDRGERLLRDECAGATWEIDTATIYSVRALFYLGQLAELRRRLPLALKEAHERGDLYLSTNLRVGYSMVHACLAGDDPASARRYSDEALAEWTYPGLHLPQLHDFMGQTTVDLYVGDVDAAERRVATLWPQITKTMYARLEYLRILFGHLRARVALAAAARATGPVRERHLASAAKLAREVAKQPAPWGQATVKLMNASVAHLRGDDAAARTWLEQAAAGFDATDMALFAAVARRQLGRLVGGDEGDALVSAADAFMTAETIQRTYIL